MKGQIKGVDLFRARVEKIVDDLQQRLELGWLIIHNKFDEAPQDDEPCTAETTSKWEYREFTIRWLVPNAIRLTDEYLELTAIHEIVHGLLSPLCDEIGDEYWAEMKLTKKNEFVTESIARAIYSALYGRC